MDGEVKKQTIFMSTQGRVTIPKHIREALGFMPGVTVEIIDTGDGVLVRHVKRDRELGAEDEPVESST
jgi:AbrB family looped-hinge helix DNA binding protein